MSFTAKIKALLQKTEENGASEEEAMSALAIAQKLMEKHGVTLEDIRDRQDQVSDEIGTYTSRRSGGNVSTFEKVLMGVISKYTDTKCYFIARAGRGSVHFFGHRVDTELADYIFLTCISAGKTEWAKYARGLPRGNRAKARVAFLIGFSDRISARLKELKGVTAEATGADLIVLKNQLVEKKYREGAGGKVKSAKLKYRANNSYSDGYAAGGNVSLGRKVSDGPSGGPKLLAGAR